MSSRPRAPAPLLLLCAAALFALMALVAKKASAALPGPQVAFMRFCMGLVACAIAATRIRMRTRNKLGLVLRGAYGGSAVLLWFLAIEHLPVGVATLLNYTSPVFTALYAALFLGEALTTATVGALTLTTLGVGCVIRGTAPPGSLGIGTWQMVGLASAVLSGAAVATIREVRKTDGPWEIFAAFCAVGTAITAVPTFASWVSPSPVQWVELFLVGLLSVAAQLFMTYALRYVRAAVAGVLAQFTPVLSLALGWVVLRESIAGIALFGAALTTLGVSWGAYLASSDARVPAIEEP